MELKDGPGRCAGRLEVQYEGRWRRVQNKDWSPDYSNIVCKQLNCGNAARSSQRFIKGSGVFLTVDCRSNTEQISDISECIKADTSNQRGGDEEPVHITCQGQELFPLQLCVMLASWSILHWQMQKIQFSFSKKVCLSSGGIKTLSWRHLRLIIGHIMKFIFGY